MLSNARNILILFSTGLIVLFTACVSETQPLPDIDDAVEEKVTEETTKVVDTATPFPTVPPQPTVASRTSSKSKVGVLDEIER